MQLIWQSAWLIYTKHPSVIPVYGRWKQEDQTFKNYLWLHNGFEAILTDIHDILSLKTERDGLFCSGFLEFYMDFRTSRSIHEEKRTPGFSAGMTLNLSVQEAVPISIVFWSEHGCLSTQAVLILSVVFSRNLFVFLFLPLGEGKEQVLTLV